MSNELIRKTDVIDLLNDFYSDFDEYSHLVDDIDFMNPVNAVEPKTGRWIDYYGEVEIYNAGGFTEKRKIGVKCSNCQRLNTWCEFDYCPHCGAKMDGDADEQ